MSYAQLIAEALVHAPDGMLTLSEIYAAISARQKGAQWPTALHLLRAMAAATIETSTISCSAAISARQKGAQWPTALHLRV